MGHNLMLEPGWADVADRIHEWLIEQHAKNSKNGEITCTPSPPNNPSSPAGRIG